MKNVNDLFVDRLIAEGLDVEALTSDEHNLIQDITPALDQLLTAAAEDRTGIALRIAGAALHAYGDLAENYAKAVVDH